MAYYNANLVIKLTREAMGITQEELSDGICHPVSLSRIENGHHMVKRDIYYRLMEKMGRIPEKYYAVCCTDNGELSEYKIELDRAFRRHDYEMAERYLQRLQENADDNLLTRQYIAKERAIVEYRRGRIGEQELLERLDTALRMTIPRYGDYRGKVFPFAKEEVLIIMNIGISYRCCGAYEKSLEIYGWLLKCLETGYMGEMDRTTLRLTIHKNCAIVYESQGRYEEAFAESIYCLENGCKIDYGHRMPVCLTEKAFNIVKLVERKILGEECMADAKRHLRQAYYIAVARGDEEIKKVIKSYTEKVFGEEKR